MSIISFRVDKKVELKTVKYDDAALNLNSRLPLFDPKANEEEKKKEPSPPQKLLVGSPLPHVFQVNQSGFVNTCIEAYNHHHHLVIRPDDVWIAILNMFQLYVNANAEKLRFKFVSHQGQKKLVVKTIGSIFTVDWSKLCEAMTAEIQKNLKEANIAVWSSANFTTSTTVDKLVCSGMLMASMKHYFKYEFELECGLPQVTLLGTSKDWQLLYEKADRLQRYDAGDGLMIQWHAMLMPVLKKFCESAEGKADVVWWNRICSHYEGGSGPSSLSGWITVFTIFNEKGQWLGTKTKQKSKKILSDWAIVDTDDICLSYTDVPIVVNDNGVSHACQLRIGHFGWTSAAKGQIQPVTGWELLEEENSE